MDSRDELIAYARCFNGTPYVYGANGPWAFDCSAFANTLCRKYGFVGPHEDLTAQGLHDKLKKTGTSFAAASLIYPKGAFVFYGASALLITHVALLVDNGKSVIECGGGNERTLTIEDAKKLGACVREVSLRFRSDVVAVILPPYP